MPSLDLKGVPVATNASKQRSQRALDILEEIQREVREMGLPEYPRPSTSPTPLSEVDVSALSNRELETHLTSYIAYAAYLEPKLAEAEMAYKISAHDMKGIKANLKVSLFKDGVPKSEIDARVQDSPEYIEKELEHLKLFAIKTILEAHHRGYRSQAQGLSRIVELRKLEYEQEQRANHVGNYKPGRPGGLGRPARRDADEDLRRR